MRVSAIDDEEKKQMEIHHLNMMQMKQNIHQVKVMQENQNLHHL